MEKTVKGLTIRIGADASELTGALDEAKRATDDLAESLKSASVEAEKLVSTLESLPFRG